MTANAPTGYHLVNWTGTGGFTSTANPVTVTNVTQAMTVTANFAVNQYAVTFQTDGTAGATLTGTTSQTVNHGSSGTAVAANAPTGYHLVDWTGTGGFTSTANPLTVTNVTQAMAVTANFAVNQYAVTFQTDGTAGATLSGTHEPDSQPRRQRHAGHGQRRRLAITSSTGPGPGASPPPPTRSPSPTSPRP